MAKNKKKRNKVYRGQDAKITQPSITRITAVNRNKPAQWWFDNKKKMKPALIAGAVIAFIIFVIYGIISVFF